MRACAKGLVVNVNLARDVSVVSASKGAPSCILWRCATLGGILSMSKSFIPSSKWLCLAVFTLLVSTSYHTIFLVVLGVKPRKIPFLELGINFALHLPSGQTHTWHPNVQKAEKSSTRPVDNASGALVWSRKGKESLIGSQWWNAHGQNFGSKLAPSSIARMAFATIRCALSTGPCDLMNQLKLAKLHCQII